MAQQKVRVLNDRVLVRRATQAEVSRGKIVIPEHCKDKPTQGVVVAVGSGKMLKNGVRATIELNEGDNVIFARHGGSDIEVDGETLRILSEDDILAVL